MFRSRVMLLLALTAALLPGVLPAVVPEAEIVCQSASTRVTSATSGCEPCAQPATGNWKTEKPQT